MDLLSSIAVILLFLLFNGDALAVAPEADNSARRLKNCDRKPTYDAAVIGAGLSGLTAAYQLSKRGLRVVVLEARDRVGGRVHGMRVLNSGVQEVGAEFIGPTQDRMYGLAKLLGLELYDEYDQGEHVMHWNGSRRTYPAESPIPPTDDASMAEVSVLIETLDGLAKQIDVNAPWKHPKAKEWDNITFDKWLATQIKQPGSKWMLHIASTSIFSTEPSQLPLLYVLSYIAAAGNATSQGVLERLITATGGAQQTRVKLGSQAFATELRKKLGYTTLVMLNAPVDEIVQWRDRYRINVDRGWFKEDTVVCAKRVIVAMSPPLAKEISYDPPLPRQKQSVLAGMIMASVGKAIALYRTPWWRSQGLSGQALSDEGAGRATFDNSPFDASYGAIMSFIEGAEMKKWDWASEKAVEKQVISDYVKYFGPQAADYTGFILQRWNREEWSKGGPVAYTLPGILSTYGPWLRQPVGGIHFAGTETSDFWVGYMDGAVRSGERAALEVLQKLRPNQFGGLNQAAMTW